MLPPHLSRIRGNHEHESTLLFVSRLGRNFLVKENEIRIDFFFLFFLFFLSNHVLAKKIDDRISRDGRFLRDINLSNLNLLSFSTVYLYIYRTYASTGGYKYFQYDFSDRANSSPNIYYLPILLFSTH